MSDLDNRLHDLARNHAQSGGFEALWHEARPRVREFARKHFRTSDQDPRVDEIEQEVAKALLEGVQGTWSEERDYVPWLFSVTKNRCRRLIDEITTARSRMVNLLVGEDGEEAQLDVYVESLSKGASKQLRKQEDALRVLTAVEGLTPELVKVGRCWILVASEQEGTWGVESEVARRLGFERTKVHRLMKELRRLLFGDLGAEEDNFSR